MTKPLRILLWSPLGAGSHYHGSGMNAFRLYNSVKSQNIHVTLAHANPEQKNQEIFKNIVQIYTRHSDNPISYIVFQWKARRWLKRNAKNYDVFHGIDVFDNTLRPAVYAEKLGLPAAIKPAQTKAGFHSAHRIYRIFGLAYLRRRLIRKVSAVVAINSQIAEDLKSYGVNPAKIHAIPNGVDTTYFYPADPGQRKALRKNFNIRENDFVVLFVGAVTSRKQPHLLLQAAKTLVPDFPHLKIVFLGPLPDSNYCRTFLQEAGEDFLKPNVCIIDHQENILPYYQCADVLCLPSLNEGMPNAVLEAMACCLPCIVTAIPGINDIIHNHVTGYLVHNENDIKKTIELLLDQTNDAEIIRQNALNCIRSNYSAESVFDQYLYIFDSLTKNS